MKVTVTMERECCLLPEDFKPYKGNLDYSLKPFKPRFCIHCGQVWVQEGRFNGVETVYDYRKMEVR